MTKRKIVIVTEGFPFWAGENFLNNEISLLNKDFDIYLLPLLLPKSASLRPLPENVRVLKPVLPRNYFYRILVGLFNLSPMYPFLKDFVYIFNDSKESLVNNFLKWITTLVNSRALLASSQIQALKDDNMAAIYLYWCNYPINMFGNFPNRIFARVHGTEFAKVNSDYIPMHDSKLSTAENTIYIPISSQAADIIYSKVQLKYQINRLGVLSNGPQNNLIMPSRIRVVSVSYMVPKKRVHLIIESLRLIGENIEVEWVHFGNGPLWEELSTQSANLPQNIKVNLMGFVSNQDILKYYRENYVDLLINVSNIEGVPVSIMEAFSFGIPVFATNVGGTGEVVNNDNGRIVESNFDVDHLASFIQNIRHNSIEKNLRANAFNMWKEKSDAEKNIDELKKILNK